MRGLTRFRRDGGRRFVVVFPGRTGSSWLRAALDEHPAIDMQGEILVGLDVAAQSRTVSSRWRRVAPGRACGFKTKMKDVADPTALAAAVDRHEAVVIRMRRDDRLRLAVSRINARRLREATGRWNAGDGTAPVTPEAIDPATLEAALAATAEEVARVDAFVTTLGRPVVEIAYVEILRDPEGVLDRVQSALGVPRRGLASSVVKNTGEDLRESLPNLDALREAFADSPWREVFEIDPARETGVISRDDAG